MKPKAIISILGAMVLISGFAGIARATLVDSNSIIQDGIEYYLQTDKFVYDLGENVEMLYRVTNLRDEDVTFEFAHQQQCFFKVSDGQTRIWAWPKYVSPAGSSFTLQPGEFKEYLKEWDMMNDNTGALVTPGNYDIMGSLAYFPIHERYVPVSVSVQAVPEPSTLLLFGTGLTGLLARKNEERG